MLNQAGFYLFERGRYTDTEPLYQCSLTIRKKAWGLGTLTWRRASTTWQSSKSRSKYAKAKRRFERALAIRRKTLGPKHPDVAKPPRLRGALPCPGPVREGWAVLRTGASDPEKALGPEHPEVAQSLSNLAALYRAQGQYAKAEPFYRRALAIRDIPLGSENPQLAVHSPRLGSALPCPGPVREERAALQAGAGDPPKDAGSRSPRRGREVSMAWQGCSETQTDMLRPNPFTSARWQSWKRPWARSTPTWRNPSQIMRPYCERWIDPKKPRPSNLVQEQFGRKNA